MAPEIVGATSESVAARAEAADRTVDFSVILPSCREAENLRLLLPRISEALDRMAASHEILVVDTVTPQDDTPEVCAELGAIHTPRRGGNDYADAIRTGFAEARGTWVAVMDADGSHDPSFLETMWANREQADVVIASRYVKGGSTENPFILVFLSRMLNAVFAMVLRMPIRDVSNSLRLYRGDRVRTLRLTSAHLDVLEEVLARMLWEQCPPARIVEVPFRFGRRTHGESKRSMVVFIWAFLTAMLRLARLKRSVRRKQAEQC